MKSVRYYVYMLSVAETTYTVEGNIDIAAFLRSDDGPLWAELWPMDTHNWVAVLYE